MIVLVTGLPAAGKSTLARSLRDELGLPLLSLDAVKEAIVDGLAALTPDRFAVRRAAQSVLVRLAAENPAGCLLDLWVNPTRDQGALVSTLRGVEHARFREVLCLVDAETAVRRYAARDRHGAHLPADEASLARIRDAAPLMGPLGLGPHLEVDTSTPVEGARLGHVVSWLRAS